MKNLFKNLVILSALVFTFACDTEPDNTIYDVLEFEKGAVLRTISLESAILNSSVPESEFIVTVEAQDLQDGGLLESVDVFVRLRDLTPDNGTNDVSSAFIKTYDASEFTTGPVGLPRITINVTYAEAFAALGVPASSIAPGDVFVIELNLNLTDGRIFGPASSNGTLTGVFFRSPFAYNALISCSPEPGTYRLDIQDAFGDGLQSDGIVVSIDGVSTSYGAGSQNGGTDFATMSIDIVVPDGTSSLTFTYPGDSFGDEVSFQIYAPDGTPLGVFIGADSITDYGCGCSITSVDGMDAVVTEGGLLPILLCAQ